MSTLRQLEEDRERSLAALTSLDREWAAGEIDEVSYRELRDDYTAQAAAAIRALEPAPKPDLPAPRDLPAPPAELGSTAEPARRDLPAPPVGEGPTAEPALPVGAGQASQTHESALPAKPPDSGPVPPDSGPVPPDSGPVPPDSGPVPPDSGPVPLESGPAAPVKGQPEGASLPKPGLQGWSALALAEPSIDRPRRVRVRRRWMLGGAIVAFAVGAGILVGSFAVARQPGEEITGNPPVTAAPSKTELSAQVAAELLQARTLVSKNSDVAAAKILTAVLAVDPTQPVALAYEGWILRLAGVSAKSSADIAQGRAMVAEATALDPSYPDAHVFLGYMYYQDSHNVTEAVAEFKMFLADKPLPALVKRTSSVIAQAFTADHQPVPATVAADLKANG